MRHRMSGRSFSRTLAHRKAMFENLAAALIKHEQIRTTLPKAKDLRPVAERLITLGKRGGLHARRQAIARLGDAKLADKLLTTLAERYAEPRRRLYPHHQGRFPLRRRRGDGDHRAGRPRPGRQGPGFGPRHGGRRRRGRRGGVGRSPAPRRPPEDVGCLPETPVTLEFLARQIRGMRDDCLGCRDDMTVLTGIALRHERQLEHLNEIPQAMLNQITTMSRQHQRFS